MAGSKENGWPNWLLEKYGELPLPSLYDFILSQEKISAEIRKQNKELRAQQEALKNLDESVKQMDDRLDKMASESGGNEYFAENGYSMGKDAKGISDADDSVKVLIQAMDIQFNLFQASQELVRNMLSTLPKGKRFKEKSQRSWRLQMKKNLFGFASGIEMSHHKLLGSLADVGVKVINPEAGSLFLPKYHRAIEQVNHGVSGCIVKVIRYGYTKNGEILRYADVSVSR